MERVYPEDDRRTSHQRQGNKHNKMLKFPLPSLFLLAAVMQASAQNLVPNWSLEDTAVCGLEEHSAIENAPPWFTPTMGTPDMYTTDTSYACGYPLVASNPDAVTLGLQPASHGVRLAGFYMWNQGDNSKEYLSVRLMATLEADSVYEISFKCSRTQMARYAINRVSVYVGDSVHSDQATCLNLVPTLDIDVPGFLTASGTWTELSGTFTAVGGEDFIIIGSFQDSSETEVLDVTMSPIWDAAYIYIDAVSLIAVNGPEAIAEFDFSAWSVAGSIMIQAHNGVGIDRVTLFDAMGRMVLDRSAIPDGRSFTLPIDRALSAAVYVLRVWAGSSTMSRKIVLGVGDHEQ